jgi:hypothetical protein
VDGDLDAYDGMLDTDLAEEDRDVADGPGDGWDDDDPLAPQARELALWARRRRQRGAGGLLALLAAATALGVWAWSLAAGG